MSRQHLRGGDIGAVAWDENESALSLNFWVSCEGTLQKECVVVPFMGRVLTFGETLGQASKPSWFLMPTQNQLWVLHS